MKDRRETDPEVFLEAGQIIGMIMRHTAAEWEQAAEEGRLHVEYRKYIRMIAEMRKALRGSNAND